MDGQGQSARQLDRLPPLLLFPTETAWAIESVFTKVRFDLSFPAYLTQPLGHREDCCRRKCDRWMLRRDVIGIACSGTGKTVSYDVSAVLQKQLVGHPKFWFVLI